MIKNEYYIDNYTIKLDDLVGKGAYGEVYGCKSKKDPQLNLCAKIMKVSDKATKVYAEREKFISEIVSKNPFNQNLVKIYYVKEIPEQQKLIIIMEKCDSNLQKYIEQKIPKTFRDNELFDFLDQFLNGYSVLYNNDIIHRDIKPENILIKRDKEKIIYKLSDFGISKIYKANDFKFTKVGTPAYAAPEINSQIKDDEIYNIYVTLKKFKHSKSQVDVYSLGIILYQMVYASFPFETQVRSIIDFIQKIKTNPLSLTGTSNFKEIIEKMLIYYPDKRMAFEYLYEFIAEKKKTLHTFPILFKDFTLKLVEKSNPGHKKNPPQNYGNPPPFYINPTPLQKGQAPFQINPNQQPQAPRFITNIQPISPHQKIKEYLQFILIDQGDIIRDEIKRTFQFYLQNSTFSFDQLRDLVRIYQRQIQNPDNCQSQTLFFFYCILSLLNNSQVQNLQNFQDKKIIEEIQKLYKNLVDSGSLK